MRIVYGAVLAALLAVPALRADLEQANAEPNLEKRSKLALENAQAALKSAREAYRQGDLARTSGLIDEIGRSVDLAVTSLHQTGKNPRRSPKWFKRAEIATRDLGRRLETFSQEMSYNDRSMLDKLRAQVQKTHEDLLTGLMEGKRR